MPGAPGSQTLGGMSGREGEAGSSSTGQHLLRATHSPGWVGFQDPGFPADLEVYLGSVKYPCTASNQNLNLCYLDRDAISYTFPRKRCVDVSQETNTLKALLWMQKVPSKALDKGAAVTASNRVQTRRLCGAASNEGQITVCQCERQITCFLTGKESR